MAHVESREGLQLRLSWGEQNLCAELLDPARPRGFSIGSEAGVDFAMGDAKLGARKFEVISRDKNGFSLRFTRAMHGELVREGQAVALSEVIERGWISEEDGAFTLALQNDDRCRVDLGGVTLDALFQPKPRPVHAPWSERVPHDFLNVLVLLGAIAAVLIIRFRTADAGEGDSFELGASKAATTVRILNRAVENRTSGRVAQKEQTTTAKRKGREGRSGERNAPPRQARSANQGKAKEGGARELVQKLLGANGSGLMAVLSPKPLDGALNAAIGQLNGPVTGQSGGVMGLGLRGDGEGGGGSEERVGLHAIETRGGRNGYGSLGIGRLPAKEPVPPVLEVGPPSVQGSLDKDLIREVIHRNRGQIRYCYESLLTREPSLKGKVAVRFVISPNGLVSHSSVAQSDAHSSELEHCVAGRVRSWVFPKPKGGGDVVVTYPFLFKASGE